MSWRSDQIVPVVGSMGGCGELRRDFDALEMPRKRTLGSVCVSAASASAVVKADGYCVGAGSRSASRCGASRSRSGGEVQRERRGALLGGEIRIGDSVSQMPKDAVDGYRTSRLYRRADSRSPASARIREPAREACVGFQHIAADLGRRGFFTDPAAPGEPGLAEMQHHGPVVIPPLARRLIADAFTRVEPVLCHVIKDRPRPVSPAPAFDAVEGEQRGAAVLPRQAQISLSPGALGHDLERETGTGCR